MDARPLWNHQVDAIRIAETQPDIFLGWEMGCGKSRATIEILRRRYARLGQLKKTLIICPIIVCDNWKKEFAMYSKINPHDVVVLTQTGRKRCQELIKACGETLHRPKILITNYQGMLINDLYELLKAWRPELLVCDESHRTKNHTAKTAKKIMALSDLAESRFLLTGTPILNTPMDLFMQFRILDSGQTFGRNFYAFRAQYFKDENAGFQAKQNYFPKWVPHRDGMLAIQQKIKNKMIRVTKEQCLDLPPLIRQEIEVKMSPEQKRMYEEMKQEYLTFMKSKELDGKNLTIIAQIAITKALRMQQILSGFGGTVEDGVKRIESNPRLEALGELLEDLTPGNKVIVWAVFKENYKMITELCDKLGIGYAQIHGDISNSKRIEEMDRFRSDPLCRVMVANQSAGGTGINLVEASYSIYYSKGFSLEHDLQSEARNHRGGSEIHDKVTRIDLVCRDSIDELINKALKNKQDISNLILDWKDKI